MSLLFDLTLRGALVALLVMGFDWWQGRRMSARSRRWWWSLVLLAFLLPVRIPLLPRRERLPLVREWKTDSLPAAPADGGEAGGAASAGRRFWPELWLAGAVSYLALVAVQTARVMRRWPRERLSTDSELLELLEDCKQEAGVTAPIGLVVSASVPSPAILGWVRPRILLPADLVSALPRNTLRAVLLHELAHFRWFDVPFNWLFSLVRAVHWFNPVAHFAFAAWLRFREEAADEAAVRWMQDPSGQSYGEALLQTLRQTEAGAVPFGALAIGESIHHLRRRITMINYHQNKSSRYLLTGLVTLFLAAIVIAQPASTAAGDKSPDPKAAAVAAMQNWLKEIDAGQYEQSWKDASGQFQKTNTSQKWVEALNHYRAPLGKCNDRRLVSAALQKDLLRGQTVAKGEFAMIQFESSFENLKYAVETVGCQKGDDGVWRSTGYYVKPRL